MLVFYLFVRYIFPIVLRAVLSNIVRQQMRKAQQAYPEHTAFYRPPAGPPPTPDQLKVDYVPPTKPTARKQADYKGGEYVDYEEVK